MIAYDSSSGLGVYLVVREMIALAKENQESVETTILGVKIIVGPGDDARIITNQVAVAVQRRQSEWKKTPEGQDFSRHLGGAFGTLSR